MAEIARNSTGVGVEFSIPAASATVTAAAIFKNGVETATTFAQIGSYWVAAIPYSVTQYDGEFQVEFTYTVSGTEYTIKEEHRVVTPLFTPESLRAFDSDFTTVSDSDIQYLDQLVRSIFKTFTGQTFGLEKKSVVVTGTGAEGMQLPIRSVDPDGPRLGGDFTEGPFALITNDGWLVRGIENNSWIDPFIGEVNYPKTFTDGRRYIFSGLWGYYSPPEDIVLAAMTLASDYGCDQSMWRDRYMKSIRMADMRFEFNPQAYTMTGNVLVDQILDRYAKTRMTIL
jgi:hypothetical protein